MEENKKESFINSKTATSLSTGHVFIVHASLTRIACDAWALPCGLDPISSLAGSHWISHVNIAQVKEKCFEDFPDAEWRVDGLRTWKMRCWDQVSPRTPQPWLVLSGRIGIHSSSWYIEGIKQFLDSVALDLTGTIPKNRRERHLVALPLVGTGYGGGKRKSGLIMKGIIAELYNAVQTYGFDLALVMNRKETYAAALQERQQYVNAFSELESRLIEEANKLVSYARKDQLVVFIGAGCSAAAGMPLWGTLLSKLEKKAGIENPEKYCKDIPFTDRAQLIQKRLEKKGKKIQTEISNMLDEYHCYALSHAMLAALPVKEYITTNYDLLFENATEDIDQRARVLPYEPQGPTDTMSPTKYSKWLLKMHGCIKHADDIVLTREHFLRYNERNQALAGIVQAMLMTKHMFFCGFSLSDDNFFNIASTVRKAMRSKGELTMPFGTAISLENNPAMRELWEEDVRLVHITQDSNIPKGARILEILLDYICAKSFTAVDHLFLPEYDDVLSKPNMAFRNEMLQFLQNGLSKEAQQSTAFKAFRAAMIKTFDAENIFSETKRMLLLQELHNRSQNPLLTEKARQFFHINPTQQQKTTTTQQQEEEVKVNNK